MPDDTPQVDRPRMPDGYGVPDSSEGMLSWAVVEARLVAARVVWMATTRGDGRPHVVPRWGAWIEGAFYYDGSPLTIHAVNLRSNGRCVLHLEDGTAATILEGTAAASDPPARLLAEAISNELTRKYADAGYAPGPDSWSGEAAGGLCRFLPDKAIAWETFPTDVTRFTFDERDGG